MRGRRPKYSRDTEPASAPPDVPEAVEQEAVKIATAAVKIPVHDEDGDAVRVSCSLCPYKTEPFVTVELAEEMLAEHMTASHRNDIGTALEAKGGAPWCEYCQAPARPTRDGKHRCQCRMEKAR